MSDTSVDWAAIHAGLSAPFAPADVDFRPQGSLTDRGQGMALAYIDARAVMDRLDAVVGPEHWYGFPDVLIADNAVRVVRYGLTIHGVTKYAIGDAADTEASKSADSDGLKRAGVPWGIGRYLYALPREWVKGEPRGKNWIIPDEELKRLRAKLGAPAQQQRAVVTQEPRNGAQATPSAPAPARAASPPAGVGSESTSPALATEAQQAQIRRAVTDLGWGKRDADAYLFPLNVARFSELTTEQAEGVIEDLQAKAAKVQALVNVP